MHSCGATHGDETQRLSTQCWRLSLAQREGVRLGQQVCEDGRQHCPFTWLARGQHTPWTQSSPSLQHAGPLLVAQTSRSVGQQMPRSRQGALDGQHVLPPQGWSPAAQQAAVPMSRPAQVSAAKQHWSTVEMPSSSVMGPQATGQQPCVKPVPGLWQFM
jgi:hypothetical protein